MPRLPAFLTRLPRPDLSRVKTLRGGLKPARLLEQLDAVRQQAHATYREGGLRAFFGPGIRLLNRHRFPWKFTLLGLLTMAATSLYVVSLNISMRAEIDTARQESRALDLYLPLATLLHASQRYSGLAWGSATDAALKPALQARAAEVDTALAQFDGALKRNADSFGLGEHWTALRNSWQKIRAAQDSFTAESIKTLLPPFNRQIEDLLGDLGEASGLLADPNRNSNLIANLLLRKYPEAADSLGRLVHTSALILGSKEMDGEWTRMAGLMSEARSVQNSLLDTLARSADANPEGKAAFTALSGQLGAAWSTVLDSADSEILKGGFSMDGATFLQAADKPAELMLAGLKPAADMLKAQLDARADRLDQRFWGSSAIGATLVGTLLYCAFGLFLTILGSVRELAEGARHIGRGELGYRIDYSARDELHDVANQFNGMAAAFAGIIDQVQHTASELSSAAASLAETAGHVTEGSQQQSQAASSMAAAVEEMTVGIDEISRNAGSADEAAAESGRLSQAGGEIVSRTVSEMGQISASVRHSASVITELGENSRQISKIVQSIKEVADQTNLLALNAAIEAARAGEEGRGFAVVADEVRKLAERTGKATAEIGSMVASIQAGTTRAVAAMQDGVRRVEDGVKLSSEAGAAMEQIREESGRALRSVNEISSALREQAVASTEIARSVEAIARMAESNHAQVSQTASTAADLVTLSRELGTEISRFHTRPVTKEPMA
ncbi:methyl-accepting chemotaxis protein [Uliginosibacterium paludis]|uniref:Methyl-accepting chemotaxis protein n=1 Tax=Uliginosibacterium paludis TaxID=1615952 RepID=A0ABV2CT55_9RHOO